MKFESERDQQKFWVRVIVGSVVAVFLTATMAIWYCIDRFQKSQEDEYNRLPVAGVAPFFMASFDPTKQDRLVRALKKFAAYKPGKTYSKKQLARMEEDLRDAIHTFTELSGENNTYVILAYDSLSAVCMAEHKWKEADEAGAKALELNEKVYGKQNKMTVRSVMDLASLKRGRKQYDEAYALYERSFKTYEKHEPPNAVATAYALEYMADVRSDQGKYADAAGLFQRALQMHTARPGANKDDVRRMHEWLGYLAIRQEKMPEALKEYHEAVDLSNEQSDFAKAADIEFELGKSLARRDQYVQSMEELKIAEELASKAKSLQMLKRIAAWKAWIKDPKNKEHKDPESDQLQEEDRDNQEDKDNDE